MKIRPIIAVILCSLFGVSHLNINAKAEGEDQHFVYIALMLNRNVANGDLPAPKTMPTPTSTVAIVATATPSPVAAPPSNAVSATPLATNTATPTPIKPTATPLPSTATATASPTFTATPVNAVGITPTTQAATATTAGQSMSTATSTASATATIMAAATATPTLTPTMVNVAGCNPNNNEQVLANLVATHLQQQRTVFKCNPILEAVARQHANDMIARNYVAHVNPDGIGPNEMVRRAGFALPDIYSTDLRANNIEALAVGTDFTSAQAAFEAWLASPNHRRQILAEGSTFFAAQSEYGMAYVMKPGAPNTHYWIFISAKPR